MDTEKETITDTEDEEISVAEAEAEAAESEEAPSAEEETSKEETTEAKGDEEATQKEEEESFDSKVRRLAQSQKDKELKPIREEMGNLRKENEELKAQASKNIWKIASDSLWEEEKESIGEEAANKKRAARERQAEEYLAWKENENYVNRMKPELEAQDAFFQSVERDQMAFRDLSNLYYPQNKEIISKIMAGVKKFKTIKDPDSYEVLLESLKESHRKSQKTFKPDSGKPRMATSGKLTQEKIDAMSTDEKIRRNEEIIAFYDSLKR